MVECQPPATDIPVWITVGKTDSQVDAQYSTVSRFQNWRLEDLTLGWDTIGETDTEVDAEGCVLFPLRQFSSLCLLFGVKSFLKIYLRKSRLSFNRYIGRCVTTNCDPFPKIDIKEN